VTNRQFGGEPVHASDPQDVEQRPGITTRVRERADPLLDTASQYTEMRYGLRLGAVLGFGAALAAMIAWPIVRRFRRARRDTQGGT
jgi:hypothetical protein